MDKNRFLRVAQLSLFTLFMVACNDSKKTTDDNAPRELFEQSCELILEFKGNIEASENLIVLDSLSENFEKRITALNFSFPAMTDLRLTEQENDSIGKLLKQLRDLKERKILEFSQITELPQDSL